MNAHENTIAEKAFRLKALLGEKVMVGVGGNIIYLYSDRGFKGTVPKFYEEIEVVHRKNAWPKPAN
jgi:hypothetical protein